MWVRGGPEAGALGLSSGLFYEPGCHASADELVALAQEMARTGGVYTSHIRDEGPGLLDSIHEAIGVGRSARVPVQISHHKASGRSNWGRVRDSLQLIEAAREEGLDVTADQYPYTAASTTLYALVQSGLGRTNSGGLGDFSADDIVIASATSTPTAKVSRSRPSRQLGHDAGRGSHAVCSPRRERRAWSSSSR